MTKKEKRDVKKFYLEMKKELIIKLTERNPGYAIDNFYYFNENVYKNIMVLKYLLSSINNEGIEYLKKLSIKDGTELSVSYSIGRPVKLIATLSFLSKYKEKILTKRYYDY